MQAVKAKVLALLCTVASALPTDEAACGMGGLKSVSAELCYGL